VSFARNIWGLAAVIVGIAGLYLLLPLGTALQFGGDEGYQLITSFLMSKGFILYKEIWSDQPPVFVLLLAWAFNMFNPSILVARVIAASFGLLMFATFYELVRFRSDQWQALLAVLFLLAAPGALELSVSVMQEVPAFALALVSGFLLFRWRGCHQWPLLWASGVVTGVALGIKLTAIVIAPAMIVAMLLESRARQRLAWIRGFLVSALQWGGAAGITFMLITLAWGQGSFQSSYMERPEAFPMPISVFLDHGECVLAAVVGIILAIQRHRVREFAFPFAWLGTALVIHLVHRPWWMYYYLHLAIPMAWLAGFAVTEMIRSFSGILGATGFRLSSSRTWKGVVLCVLVALALVRSEKRVEAGARSLRERTRVDGDPILAKMKGYAARTHWVYVRYTKEAYAFHARLPMPPELAMVTLKRFWSGQISAEGIVDTCRRHKPEQVLLNPGEIISEWRGFLTNYVVVYQDENNVLYHRVVGP